MLGFRKFMEYGHSEIPYGFCGEAAASVRVTEWATALKERALKLKAASTMRNVSVRMRALRENLEYRLTHLFADMTVRDLANATNVRSHLEAVAMQRRRKIEDYEAHDILLARYDGLLPDLGEVLEEVTIAMHCCPDTGVVLLPHVEFVTACCWVYTCVARNVHRHGPRAPFLDDLGHASRVGLALSTLLIFNLGEEELMTSLEENDYLNLDLSELSPCGKHAKETDMTKARVCFLYCATNLIPNPLEEIERSIAETKDEAADKDRANAAEM